MTETEELGSGKTPLRKNAQTTRGRPFTPGNPGRPKGARNKATLAAEVLLDREAEAITRKAVEMALEGDTTALRLCMERICPPRKERPVQVTLPSTETSGGLVRATAAVIGAVARGEIAPGEGQALSALLEAQRRTVETVDLERRITDLEGRVQGR